MGCPDCRGTGRITIEIPVFADGNYSDVDQIERPCACNPDPTDDDAHGFDDFGHPGETEYPADFDVPEVDYDRTIDGLLPAHLLG